MIKGLHLRFWLGIFFLLFVSVSSRGTTFYSQGDNLFSDLTNWNDAIGGGGSNPILANLTSGGHDFVIQDGHTITLDTNISVSSMLVGSPGVVAGNLILGDDISGDTLTIGGAFTVSTNASVTVSNNNATHLIIARGAITNNGTLNLRNSYSQICNLQLDGTFAIGGAPALTKLGSFIVISGTVTTNIPLDIDGSVILTAGTWVGGGIRHEVSGNWQIAAGNYSYIATDTIDFNTAIVTILDGVTEYFANVLLSGGGVFSASNSMVVTESFIMSNGSQFTSGTTQYFRGTVYNIEAGCEYTQSASWTYFDGSSAMTLNLDGQVNWYYVRFDNGAPAVKNIASGTFDAQDRVYIYNDAVVSGAGNYEMAWISFDGTCNWSGTITLTGGTSRTGNADGLFQIGTADIIIAGSVSIAASDTLIVAGDVTMQSGYLILNQNSHIQPDVPATRNFTQDAATRLYMRGTDVFPSTDFILSLNPRSYQRYDRNYKQYIQGGVSYGYMELYYDTLIVKGDITVNGYLGMWNALVLDMGAFTHHIKGYIYNGTNNKRKLISTGTVYLDGRGTQVLYNASTASGGGYWFNNLIIDDDTVANRTVYFREDTIRVNGDFEIRNTGSTGGDYLQVYIEANNRYIINDGDAGDSLIIRNYARFYDRSDSCFKYSGESFDKWLLEDSSLVMFHNYNGDQWMPAGQYGNIYCYSNTNGEDKYATGAMDINGYLQASGNLEFYDGGFTHTIAGDWIMDDRHTDAGSLTGKFIFDGVNQSIANVNARWNLVDINCSGTLTSSYWMRADSTMTIKNGATLSTDNTIYLTNGHLIVDPTGDLDHTGGWIYIDGTQNTQDINIQNPNTTLNGILNYKYGVGTDTLRLLSNVNIEGSFYYGYWNNGAPHRMNVTELTNGDTLSIGGDIFTPYVSNLTTSRILFNGGALHFNGNSNIQYFYHRNAANQFNDVIFSGSAEKYLWSPNYAMIYDIEGNMTINSSTVSGGSRDIYIAGDFTNNSGAWQDARTTNFDGLNQNIGSSDFRTVWFIADTNAAGDPLISTKNIVGDLSIDGHVYIDTNAFVNAGVTGNTIEVLDDWFNNRGGFFLPGNSKTIFTGNYWSEIYNGGSGLGHEFFDFTVDKDPSIRVRLRDTLDVNGSLVIENGYLRTRDNQIFVAQNLTNNDIIEYNIAGTRITMDGTTASATYNFNGNSSYFRDIVFKADPTVTYQMGSDLNMYSNYTIAIDSGKLDLNAKTLTMQGGNGDIIITEGGSFEVDSAAILKMDNGSDLTNNGGALRIFGDSLDPAIVTIRTTGNYAITQTGVTSTLFMKNFKVESTSGNGVDIQAGAIDVTTGLDNGVFTNGVGTAYLTVNAVVDISGLDTVRNTHFNAGPTSNVSRTAGSGVFKFLNSIGSLSGESYDNDNADPGTLIEWHYDGIAYWDGNTDADGDNVSWNDPNNWVTDAVPTASDIVFLDHSAVAGAYAVNLNTTKGECQSIVLAGGGTAITLTMNGVNLEVNGDLTVSIGDIVDMTTNATDTIKVKGNWTNDGTFNEGSAAVMFNGILGTSTIQTGGSADPFYHLHFKPLNSKIYTLASPIGVDGTFTLDSGTVDVVSSANIIYASGDWVVSGSATMEPQTGAVHFDKPGDQSIDGGTFYTFYTTGSGTKTLQSALNTVDNGLIQIGAGTILDAQANNMFIKGHWRNDVGNAGFIQIAPGAVFFNGAYQDIGQSTGNETTFNDVYFQGTNYKNIYGTMNITGNMYHTSQSVYLRPTYYINSDGSGTFTQSGGAMLSMGYETGGDSTNFPDGFGTYNMSGGSQYFYGDGDQLIDPLTYYRVYFYTPSTGVAAKRTLRGDITIGEHMYINDNETTVDVDDYTINLYYNWNHTTGAPQIDWGTNGTLNQYGPYTFWFDPDIDTVNNVIFSGSGTKGNYYDTLAIGGDFEIQAGISYYLRYPARVYNSSKTFTMASGVLLRSYVGQPDTAFFTGYDNYIIDPNSRTYLYSGLSNTKVNIYDVPNYGLLYLGNSDTALALGDLDVEGNFWMGNSAIFVDANNDMNFAGNVDVRTYDPGTGVMTLDGGAQLVNDGSGGNVECRLPEIVMSGSGIKTFQGEQYYYEGDIKIESGVEWRPYYYDHFFLGDSLLNSGTIYQQGYDFHFAGKGTQVVDPGADNRFSRCYFEDSSIAATGNITKFINYGIDIDGYFIQYAGDTIDWGTNLDHELASPTFTVPGPGNWLASNANFHFDRNGSQYMPALIAQDVYLEGGSWKRPTGNMQVDDITIDNGVSINFYDPSNSHRDTLIIYGNFTCNGTIADYESTFQFESNSSSAKTIKTNDQWIYNIEFNQNTSVSRTWAFQDESRVDEGFKVGSNATVDLNSQILHWPDYDGYSVDGDTMFIQSGGVLEVDAGAELKVYGYGNRANEDVKILVEGRLRVVGDISDDAKISAENSGYNRRRYEIEVTTGVMEAQYYSIENMGYEGLHIYPAASIDATNNLSNGSFTGFQNSYTNVRHYMQIDCPAPAANIQNVTFNFSGTPVIGRHFNVRRPEGTAGIVTFDGSINGILAGETYEDDSNQVNLSSSIIDWPPVTEVTWTGAVSTEWNLAGNWSPAQIPDSTINANIPLVINNPIISTINAYCNNLTLSDGVLIMDGGYDLGVVSDIVLGQTSQNAILAVANNTSDIRVSGGYTVDVNGVFVHGSSTMYFDKSGGSAVINPRDEEFYNLTLDGGATYSYTMVSAIYPMTVEGKMAIQSGTFSSSTTWYQLFLEGDAEISGSGDFDESVRGTVFLSGTGAQDMDDMQFYRLDLTGSGVKTFDDSIFVEENLYVRSGAEFEATNSSNIYLDGNVDFDAGSTFDDGGDTLYWGGGSWYGDGSLTINPTGLVVGNLSRWHYFYDSKFNNIELQYYTRLYGNVEINGDLTINNDNLNFYVQCYNNDKFNDNTGTGTYSIGAGESIYVYGPDNHPDGFGTYTADRTSRTYYQGTADQTIRAAQYGYLMFYYNNKKTLEGNIDGLNHIYIYDYVDLYANNFDIQCAGHWYNNYLGEFYSGTGKVTMDGTTFSQAIQISDNGSNKSFYDLEINNDATYYVYPGVDKLTVLNDLTVIQGRFYPNNQDIEIGNNMLASGTGKWWNTNGDYILNKASGTANISFNGGTVGAMTIGTGATTTAYTLLDDAYIEDIFQIKSGTTFDGAGYQVEFRGNGDAMTVDGLYKIGAGGELQMETNSTLQINSGGEFQAVGSVGSSVVVTNRTGRYNFIINGKIQAKYALFEYMENNGVQINPSGWVDTTNNFSFCTFNNCDWGGACLTIENGQGFTDSSAVPGNLDPWIEDVSFPTNPVGGASNVKKIVGTAGRVEFFNSTGVFEGEDYDNDPSDLIDWIEPQEMYWTGNVDADWYNVANWSANFGVASVPTRDLDAIIPAGRPRYPILVVGAAEVKNLNIELGGIVTMNTVADSDSDLVVFSELSNDGALFMNSVNDTLYLSGNFNQSATGVFTANAGRVILVPSTGVASISNLYPFNDLESSATGNVSLSANATVNGEFKINSGIFDVNNRTLTTKGNFLNSGTFDGGTGTVYLSGSGAKTFKPGSGSFYDLEISGAADYTMLTDNLYVDRNYSQSNGSLTVNSLTFNIGDNSGADNISISGGELIIGNNGTLGVGTNATINVSGGNLIIAGSSGNLATVTRRSGNTTNYGFTVASGGAIKANYATFEYMNSSGVNIASGAMVDLDSNFSFCIFQNCNASGPCLIYNGSQLLSGSERVLQATFADAVSGGKRNVKRTNSGAGEIEFLFADGTMSGEDYDDDSHDKIHWSAELTWTGGVDNDWDEPGNWNDGIGGTFIPTKVIDVVIPAAMPRYPIILSTLAAATGYSNKVTIDNGGSIIVNAGAHFWANDSINNSGTLTIAAGSTVMSTRSSLMNNGTINFNADTLKIEDNFTNTATLNLGTNTLMRVGENFTNSSVFTMASGSTIEFYKSTGTVSLNSGGATLQNLSLKSAIPATAVFQTASSLDINSNVSITGGKLEVTNAAHTITVGGNWSNTVGTTGFDGGSGTVSFDGTAVQNISNSTASFNHLVIANTTAKVIPAVDMYVDGNFTINNSASFDVTGRDIYIGGNWTNNAGAAGFDAETRAVVLTGGSAQVISTTTPSVNFYEFQLNKSAGVVTIAGGKDLDIAGRFFINDDNGGGSFSPGAGDIYIEGNWRNELGAGGFIEGTSKVIFDGSGNSDIISTAASQNFYKMEVNKTIATNRVRTQPGTNLDINDSLILNKGILSVTDFALETSINIAGHWDNNVGISAFEEGNAAGTVIFDGSSTQNITSTDASESFNNLTISTTGGAEVRSDAATLIDINGDLTISANGILNPQNKNITIAGDWSNSNAAAGYVQGTETVTFDGSTNQTITNSASLETFDELTIATTGGADVRTSGAAMTIDVDGDLTINNNSILNLDAGDGNLNLFGQWNNNNGAVGFVEGSTTETVTFNGTSNQLITSSAATESFNDIVFANNGAVVRLDATTDLDVNGDLTINASGVLDVNTNNNDVTIAGNWNNQNGAAGFDQGTETVTFDGGSAQQITASVTEVFNNFTLANSGNTVTLNDDIEIDAQLNLSTAGYIDANSNTITIDNWNDATSIANLGTNLDRYIILTDNTEHVIINDVDNGETAVFPVGTSAGGAANYARVDYLNNHATTTNVDVEVWTYLNLEGTSSGGTPVTDDALSYTWDITPSAAVGSRDADLTLYWGGASEQGSFDRTVTRLSHHNGTEWEYLTLEGASVNFAGTVWQFSGNATSFSPFSTDSKPSSPLPIELTDFVAYLEGAQVRLEWETSSEINNDFFLVERSQDGNDFIQIAKVAGAGNSNLIIDYEAVDENPYIGLSYYRLKQVDFDGKFTYSKLIPINNDPFSIHEAVDQKSFSISPNPSDGSIINIVSNRKYLPHDEIFVIVIDATGKELYSKVILTNDEGEFATAIDPYDRIPAGIYVIIGSSRDDIFSDILIIE